MFSHPSRILLVAALSTVAIGCGNDNDDSQVESGQQSVLATIDALQTASEARDGERICNDVFSPALARAVQSAAGRACRLEVQRTLVSPGDISVSRDIAVKGDEATALITQSGAVSTVQLRRLDGQWRIQSVTAGAGGGADASIRTVLTNLQKASVTGNGRMICDSLFTSKLSARIAQQAGDCAGEVRAKLFSPDTKLTVRSVDVADSTNASAIVRESSGAVSKISLVNAGAGWQIRSVVPAAG